MTAAGVRDLLRQACANAGSQQAWATEHGVSPQYVGDVLLGRREPGDKILGGLGLRKIVTYETMA
ncbi:transcriptional regulator [Aurantimonas sp. DM33-3]|uniref:transcriptional regulator n=1 Tax=Aurantimonas TaxID=182269 RepID=UPI0016521C1C|nr:MULTISPECIES: transcriptional regulator [Aurantimonas]MBC6716944.1 transcriptional regulator [Aurantimonas sp. DM33-3]MCC4298409.1 transcriptional regulator [Aurantimonas coralicida]